MEVSMKEVVNISDKENILSRINYQELITIDQSLSKAYRTVFNINVIDGYKHEEIAKSLGISINTSKSNLTRTRAKLRDLTTKKINTPYV